MLIQQNSEYIRDYAVKKIITATGLVYYYDSNNKLITVFKKDLNLLIARSKILSFIKQKRANIYEQTKKYDKFNSNYLYAINRSLFEYNLFNQSYLYNCNILQLDIKNCYVSIFSQIFELDNHLIDILSMLSKSDRLKLLGSYAKKSFVYKKQEGDDVWNIDTVLESEHKHLFFVCVEVLNKINKYFIDYYNNQILAIYCDSIYLTKNTLFQNLKNKNFEITIKFLNKDIKLKYDIKRENMKLEFIQKLANCVMLKFNDNYNLSFSKNCFITI